VSSVKLKPQPPGRKEALTLEQAVAAALSELASGRTMAGVAVGLGFHPMISVL
jgi:hypothetical protein